MSLVAGKVEILQTELGAHAAVPLVVVNEGPSEDASHVNTIQDACGEDVVEEALHVVCTAEIPQDLLEGVEVLLIWIGEAELSDHDALGGTGWEVFLGD